jgi:hypothetical protein
MAVNELERTEMLPITSPDKTVFEIETCDFRLGYSSLVPQITTFSDLSHIGTTASICTVFKN